jgi:hypothetical protein
MISRCTSKDDFTVAREVRPSLFDVHETHKRSAQLQADLL